MDKQPSNVIDFEEFKSLKTNEKKLQAFKAYLERLSIAQLQSEISEITNSSYNSEVMTRGILVLEELASRTEKGSIKSSIDELAQNLKNKIYSH